MRAWLMIGMLAAVALSGCASEEGLVDVDGADTGTSGDGNGAVDPTGGGNATGEDSGNATGDVAENLAPVLTVTADVVNGTAPLLVSFTLSVEDDSDSITWAFLIEGNETLTGEGATAAFNHTFEAGTWSLTIVADDGTHTVNESFEVTAAEAAGADVPEPVTISGSVVVPLMDTPVSNCSWSLTDYPTLGPEYWGWHFQARENWVAEFWQGDASILASSNSGTVPENADNVGSCPTQGTVTNATTWTITLTHPDYEG